jgi:hypothetical protein
VRVIGNDFCEEAGLGVPNLLDTQLGGRAGGRVSLESRLDVWRLQHQLFYPCGTPFWASESGVLFPCGFFCFPDELNRSFSFEGTFILNYTCISMMDAGKLACHFNCSMLYSSQSHTHVTTTVNIVTKLSRSSSEVLLLLPVRGDDHEARYDSADGPPR